MKGVPFLDYYLMIPSAFFRVNSHLKIQRNAKFLPGNQTLVCAIRYFSHSKEGTPFLEWKTNFILAYEVLLCNKRATLFDFFLASEGYSFNDILALELRKDTDDL